MQIAGRKGLMIADNPPFSEKERVIGAHQSEFRADGIDCIADFISDEDE